MTRELDLEGTELATALADDASDEATREIDPQLARALLREATPPGAPRDPERSLWSLVLEDYEEPTGTATALEIDPRERSRGPSQATAPEIDARGGGSAGAPLRGSQVQTTEVPTVLVDAGTVPPEPPALERAGAHAMGRVRHPAAGRGQIRPASPPVLQRSGAVLAAQPDTRTVEHAQARPSRERTGRTSAPNGRERNEATAPATATGPRDHAGATSGSSTGSRGRTGVTPPAATGTRGRTGDPTALDPTGPAILAAQVAPGPAPSSAAQASGTRDTTGLLPADLTTRAMDVARPAPPRDAAPLPGPHRSQRPHHRPGLLLRIVAAVAALVVVATLGVAGYRRVRPPRAPPPPPGEHAAGVFLQALELLRRDRLEAARAALGEVGAAGSIVEVPTYLERVERELRASQVLAAAGVALTAGDLPRARDHLAEVDPASRAGRGAAALQTLLEQRRAERTAELVARRDAGDAQAAGLLAQLAAAFPSDARLSAAAAPVRPAARALRGDPALEAARQLYREGQLDAAVERLQKLTGPAAAKLLGRVSELQRARRVAERLEGPAAVAPLEAALAADRALGASPSVRTPLAARLSGLHEEQAKEALERGHPEAAFRHVARALALAPDRAGARAVREALRERARELYLAAYVERDSDPGAAMDRLRRVVAITAPDEEVHRKARSWLARLEGTAPVDSGSGAE